MKLSRIAVTSTLAASLLVPVAVIGAPPASANMDYSSCMRMQWAAYRQDVRDVGQFIADVVMVGREYACAQGWA